MIQKLAQHLKFDTFIDENAYTHVIEKPSDLKFNRLSIGGTRILIDIDYTDDSSIIKVDLSLALAIGGVEEENKEKDISKHIVSRSDDDKKDLKIVTIDFDKNHSYSIITTDFENNGADKLLYNTLTNSNKKLNSFPINLKFLNTLDKLSSSSIDLFSYLNNITLLLNVIHKLEAELKPNDWLIEQGLSNRIGKPIINNFETNELGLFLNFWQDFRYINHKLPESQQLGSNYSLSINIDESEQDIVDYLNKSRFQDWRLIDNDNKVINHKFAFQDGSHLGIPGSSDSQDDKKWSINLKLNQPILVPLHLIEYLGILNYKEDLNDEDEEAVKILEQGKIINASINDTEVRIELSQAFPQKIISLKSLELVELNDIAKIIPILRNYIILKNIIKANFVGVESNNEVKKNKVNENSELSIEAKNKLKESLKLPNDVTDEELLGLNVISDTSGAFNDNSDIKNNKQSSKSDLEDLDEFMKDDNELQEKKVNQENQDPYIILSVDDIEYDSPNTDLKFSISGIVNKEEISFEFNISNGETNSKQEKNEDIEMKNEDIEMIDEEMDKLAKNEKNNKFIKSLDFTEDIIKSLEYAFR